MSISANPTIHILGIRGLMVPEASVDHCTDTHCGHCDAGKNKGGGEVLGHGRFVVGYAVPQGECPVLPEMFRRASIAEDTRPITHNHVPLVAGIKEIPKPLYKELLRLMPKATRHDLRRATGILWIITSKRQHRNDAPHDASCMFRELIYIDAATRDAAERLLFHAAELCGYVAKDGAAAAMATIRSGLGLDKATDGT